MTLKSEWKSFSAVSVVFLVFFLLPIERLGMAGPVIEALALVRWYAREHVLLCLIPAFFIAGAIASFISQSSVMKYLGSTARKPVAYGVASVSGAVLAVCSCTVLPLFAGIYSRGAGLGPASAFLYAGPAINVLAIVLTARVLGPEIGIARAVGAVVFSIVIGLLMQLIFVREERERSESAFAIPEDKPRRPLWQNAAFIATMIAILVFANWARPDSGSGIVASVHTFKWPIVGALSILLGLQFVAWFRLRRVHVLAAGLPPAVLSFAMPGHPLVPFAVGVAGVSTVAATGTADTREWLASSWELAKRMIPLLFVGVLIAGALLGRPNGEGLIPSSWIASLVGGNSLGANVFASVVGAFMYFATLTEVPILEGLLGSGMGKGPALALLLAGPALSLPNMLVIRSIIGTRKTLVYVVLVVVMAATTGSLFGLLTGGT